MRTSLVLACVVACGTQQPIETTSPQPSATQSAATAQTVAPDVAPDVLQCMVRYYGGDAQKNENGWALVLPNATIRVHPDIEDVFELTYKSGKIEPISDPNYDPGRVRIDDVFFATYGATAKDVERSLASVKLGGKWFAVHQKIKAPVMRVAARIDEAMKSDASLAKFFESPGGTFNWRKIAGTDELSMHAWGIAIDLDTKRANYWRNAPQNPLVWKNHYPQAIVDAFEAEGFIWGGRWFHFDTMHFEYRPELLDARCYPKKI